MSRAPKHIRFGVLQDGASLCVWEEMVLQKLTSQAGITLELLIVKKNKPAPVKSGILWVQYYRHYVRRRAKALRLTKDKSIFVGVPSMHCNFVSTEGRVTLKDNDIAKIKNAELDFILDFSSERLFGKILGIPKYGVWNYHFGNLENYLGNTYSFWEIYNEDLITSAYLTRLGEEAGTSIVLREGHLKTQIGYPKNIDNIHFEVIDWPLKMVNDIINGMFENGIPSIKVKIGKKRPSPHSIQLFIFFFVQCKLMLKKIIKLLFYTDYWNIGIAKAPIHEFLDSRKVPTIQWFSELTKTRFMADPFGLHGKDGLYVVYEDLCFDQGIGKIASFLFEKDSFVKNELVIDETFHMSYPFILEHDNEVFCIPETYQTNQVRLYKAEEFPLKWKLEKVLIDDYAGIDSTPFKYGNTWFLFSTEKNTGPHHNLNIHYSDSIFGPWQQHPKNPVKTDIRSSRPAGTLFEYGGDIFRPSMDYSEKIEGRIIINKIQTLTITDFKEVANNIVDPFKDTYFSDKVHTLSRVGDYTLIDGAKELLILSSFSAFKYKIKRILFNYGK